MDNWFFLGGVGVLAVIFTIAAVIKKKKKKNSGDQQSDDPSDIYPMW